MKIEKKILLCNILVRALGAFTGIAVIQKSQFWSAVFLALTGAAMEVKDYLSKKQNNGKGNDTDQP